MILIALIIGYFYYSHASAYANGMAKYATRNNNFALPQRENCWQSVKDETIEFIDEVLKCRPREMVMEFIDVVHASIKMICIHILPQSIVFEPYIWYFVFPFVLPVSIKLAERYKKFGCIRNHSRPNNHKCELNDKI
jgi:hypothetical protein